MSFSFLSLVNHLCCVVTVPGEYYIFHLAVILVSHSMEDLANYVDRMIVMNHGEKVFDDKTKNVFAHYKELEWIGLSAPAVTYIMDELKQKGFPVSTDVIHMDDAEREILNVIKGGGQRS